MLPALVVGFEYDLLFIGKRKEPIAIGAAECCRCFPEHLSFTTFDICQPDFPGDVPRFQQRERRSASSEGFNKGNLTAVGRPLGLGIAVKGRSDPVNGRLLILIDPYELMSAAIHGKSQLFSVWRKLQGVHISFDLKELVRICFSSEIRFPDLPAFEVEQLVLWSQNE